MTSDQADPMSPCLRPQSILVLDRHYQSLARHDPSQPNIYGVKLAGTLLFRYASRDSDRLILRPSAIDQPVKLLEFGEDSSLADFIAGHVCFAFAPV